MRGLGRPHRGGDAQDHVPDTLDLRVVRACAHQPSSVTVVRRRSVRIAPAPAPTPTAASTGSAQRRAREREGGARGRTVDAVRALEDDKELEGPPSTPLDICLVLDHLILLPPTARHTARAQEREGGGASRWRHARGGARQYQRAEVVRELLDHLCHATHELLTVKLQAHMLPSGPPPPPPRASDDRSSIIAHEAALSVFRTHHRLGPLDALLQAALLHLDLEGVDGVLLEVLGVTAPTTDRAVESHRGVEPCAVVPVACLLHHTTRTGVREHAHALCWPQRRESGADPGVPHSLLLRDHDLRDREDPRLDGDRLVVDLQATRVTRSAALPAHGAPLPACPLRVQTQPRRRGHWGRAGTMISN
eukprot:151347-Rhodomonas_salina.1